MQNTPIWRSITALTERLNEGATTPTYTDHAIRHLVRRGEENGLEVHIRRIGSKILIDEIGFLEWINQQGHAKTPKNPQDQGRLHSRISRRKS